MRKSARFGQLHSAEIFPVRPSRQHGTQRAHRQRPPELCYLVEKAEIRKLAQQRSYGRSKTGRTQPPSYKESTFSYMKFKDLRPCLGHREELQSEAHGREDANRYTPAARPLRTLLRNGLQHTRPGRHQGALPQNYRSLRATDASPGRFFHPPSYMESTFRQSVYRSDRTILYKGSGCVHRVLP